MHKATSSAVERFATLVFVIVVCAVATRAALSALLA